MVLKWVFWYLESTEGQTVTGCQGQCFLWRKVLKQVCTQSAVWPQIAESFESQCFSSFTFAQSRLCLYHFKRTLTSTLRYCPSAEFYGSSKFHKLSILEWQGQVFFAIVFQKFNQMKVLKNKKKTRKFSVQYLWLSATFIDLHLLSAICFHTVSFLAIKKNQHFVLIDHNTLKAEKNGCAC